MKESVEVLERYRVAIVEDDPNSLDFLIETVSAASQLDIAGVAGSVADAVKLIPLSPDLFVVDLGLPDGSGLDLIQDIRASSTAKILVATSFGDRDTVVQAISRGADGYFLKDNDSTDIVEGILRTINGGAPISPSAAAYLLDHLREDAVEGSVSDDDKADNAAKLSEKEVKLLNLFARGLSYKEAAKVMEVSPHSIGNYVKSIYKKLSVHSRSGAVYAAVQSGQLKL